MWPKRRVQPVESSERRQWREGGLQSAERKFVSVYGPKRGIVQIGVRRMLRMGNIVILRTAVQMIMVLCNKCVLGRQEVFNSFNQVAITAL